MYVYSDLNTYLYIYLIIFFFLLDNCLHFTSFSSISLYFSLTFLTFPILDAEWSDVRINPAWDASYSNLLQPDFRQTTGPRDWSAQLDPYLLPLGPSIDRDRDRERDRERDRSRDRSPPRDTRRDRERDRSRDRSPPRYGRFDRGGR